jgi:EpsI family protein
MGITSRILITAVLLAAGYGGVEAIRARRSPPEQILPRRNPQELPSQLGSWQQGPPLPPPEIPGSLDADFAVNRQYQNPAGDAVLLHVSLWVGRQFSLPHPPEVCYPAAGYRLDETKDLLLDLPDGTTIPVRRLTCARDGRQVYVLYWYQRGKAAFTTILGHRKAIFQAQSGNSWSPLAKVMLQTSAVDAAEAQARLESIAVPLFLWTREL